MSGAIESGTMAIDRNARPVGVDLSALRSRLTGIGNYELNLLAAMVRRADCPRLVGFGQHRWIEVDRAFVEDAARRTSDSGSLRAMVSSRLIQVLGRTVMASSARRTLRGLAFRSTIKTYDPRFFHAFSFVPPGPTSCPAIPVVYDLSFVRYPEAHPTARLRSLAGLAKVLESAPVIHSISEFSAGEICAVYGISRSRIRVIYPGVAPVFLNSTVDPTPLLARLDLRRNSFFLVVSTLEPRKNLRTVVAAFAGLPKVQRQGNPLCIVGADGWGGLDLPSEAELLGREGTLRFLGYVPNSELAQLYASARRFLYPSFYEGFGMPIIEALACGAKVICSHAASMPEAGGAFADMVHPLDVGVWRDKMSAALDQGRDPTAPEAPARSEHLRRFTWDRAAEQTLTMYRELP